MLALALAVMPRSSHCSAGAVGWHLKLGTCCPGLAHSQHTSFSITLSLLPGSEGKWQFICSCRKGNCLWHFICAIVKSDLITACAPSLLCTLVNWMARTYLTISSQQDSPLRYSDWRIEFCPRVCPRVIGLHLVTPRPFETEQHHNSITEGSWWCLNNTAVYRTTEGRLQSFLDMRLTSGETPGVKRYCCTWLTLFQRLPRCSTCTFCVSAEPTCLGRLQVNRRSYSRPR